jgi:uroporphyrinogen-III synthase
VDARSAASKSGSSGLADALGIQPGQRVLLPQSAQNKAGLSKVLTAAGADVTVVTAYRTVPAQEGDDVPTMLWQGKIDVVTFSSPSSIRFFRKRLDMMGGKLGMLQDVVVACMDPATANIARQHGLSVRIMPEKQSVAGLVEALTQYFDSA